MLLTHSFCFYVVAKKTKKQNQNIILWKDKPAKS